LEGKQVRIFILQRTTAIVAHQLKMFLAIIIRDPQRNDGKHDHRYEHQTIGTQKRKCSAHHAVYRYAGRAANRKQTQVDGRYHSAHLDGQIDNDAEVIGSIPMLTATGK
jgi:hypothetical protein